MPSSNRIGIIGREIGNAVLRVHRLSDRNDIKDDKGKAQRGWKGLMLREDSTRAGEIFVCTPEFAETLRAYKGLLLSLLKLPFVMVFSEALGETILFCQDEATKAALVEARRRAMEHIYP
jgi:hypothetical protein